MIIGGIRRKVDKVGLISSLRSRRLKPGPVSILSALEKASLVGGGTGLQIVHSSFSLYV